jgi:hypothetical protein
VESYTLLSCVPSGLCSAPLQSSGWRTVTAGLW